jgi:bacteriocin biosynthesis cyclodehydratase domain-containing protein
MEQPRMKRTLDLVSGSGGELYVLRPTEDTDLRIELEDERARSLLAALDGSRTVAELADEFGGDSTTQALAELGGLGLLEDAADDERVSERAGTRYDRQLRYFGDLARDGVPASEYQRRLAAARVVLLGVGGLGSWAAYALACCGVGTLVLVDGDRVEESNFNRQILYRERDVGRPKVEAAADSLAEFDSECRLETVARRLDSLDAVRDVAKGADFVVNGADWPAHDIERWANAACFALGVPFISMSHSPPVARVGPLYVPGETGCFECQEALYRDRFPLYDELVEQRRGRPSQAATLGPVCAFVGGQVALEAVHQLTGLVRPATLGRAYVYDLRTMAVRTEDVPRVPGCAVCGGWHATSPARHTASRVRPDARLGPESTGRGRV